MKQTDNHFVVYAQYGPDMKEAQGRWVLIMNRGAARASERSARALEKRVRNGKFFGKRYQDVKVHELARGEDPFNNPVIKGEQ